MADVVDVDALGVKALRELIASAGLTTHDCVEKSDLRQRAREAQAKLAARPAAAAPAAGAKTSRTIAGYACTVCAPSSPDLLVLLLHGFGASSGDFADLPTMAAVPGKQVAWVFPQAPVGQLGAPAWWHLDAMQWMAAAQQGGASLATLIRQKPPGLDEARTRLKQLVQECQAMFGLPLDRVALAGFSQGAMTAMDLALALEGPVAGVAMLSGAPIVVEEWAKELETRPKGLRVFISHGQSDMVLPFAASGWSRDLLAKGGADVEFHSHGGGHDLGTGTLPKLVTFWASL